MLRQKSDTFGKQLQQRNRAIESFEEIANTYLKTSLPKAAQALPAKAAPRFAVPAWVPWLAAAAFLAIAIALFVSNASFDVKIRVLNKTPFVNKASVSEGAALSGKEMLLIRGGQSASPAVANAVFSGGAAEKSSASAEQVTLIPTGDAAASYRIEFRKPLNLTRIDIGYFAKSDAAGARLVMVISDTSNRTYRVEDNAVAALSRDWHAYTVNLKPVKGSIDLTAITAIRFEFGSSTVGNPPGTAIALKDVYLTKSKRLKWL